EKKEEIENYYLLVTSHMEHTKIAIATSMLVINKHLTIPKNQTIQRKMLITRKKFLIPKWMFVFTVKNQRQSIKT
ncbi:hypothetical protein ACQP3J_32155, partial [Escherichia coli]